MLNMVVWPQYYLISAHTAKFFNSLHLFLAPRCESGCIAGEKIGDLRFYF